ncbi:MAG: cobalt-precorrin-5B (C(1))-methyltransferase CbiD [Muribaculaceae bacterium]|nr:cobalt-precorrin-5B (C(1))-methyltransferase CbiD [Muribaculaceae bacterium]
MILIFGGTTEGRMAADVAEKAGKSFYYSTLSSPGQEELVNGLELCGPMDAAAMATFCREHEIRLIIDAAHPFASALHDEVAKASRLTGLPVVRVERVYDRPEGDVVWCDGWKDALEKLETCSPRRLLVLTGVKTIGRLKPFWRSRPETVFRVLDRPQSVEMAVNEGVERDKVIFYDSATDDEELFRELTPDAIITKESGRSGGFDRKVEAAIKLGIKVFVVRRPELPAVYADTVTGPHGLRRAIERLADGFFDLRSGYTTGACATAAATAAMQMLLTGKAAQTAGFELPDGEWMEMPVCDVARHDDGSATATAEKDRSDDPDVTRGCRVRCEVRLISSDEIVFRGGVGVGMVTLPGIGLAIGEPAINSGPRAMMIRALRRVYPRGGVEVTISVPGGDELAQRTFNPRIGIEGGISIIGTSGIVTPFSHEAFVNAMRREMEVAAAMGCRHVALNSGAKSERAVRDLLPTLPPQSFIHYGNAVGDALRLASEIGFEEITLSMMLGKAVKLASGQLNTHSHISRMDTGFIAQLAEASGATTDILQTISTLNMASELWTLLTPSVMANFKKLLIAKCMDVCRPLTGSATLRIMILNP